MLIEQSTLKNNLNTLFIDSAGSSTATIQIWFKAGSSLENNSNHGIAHFLEHMFFKGTKKYPGIEMVKEIESTGGEVNAFTSFDYTCYYINSPSTALIESIDILLEMVSKPMFKEEDIPGERGVVFEEFRRSIDSSSQYNFWQIQKNFFKGNYNHAILGNEKTIKNFSKEQLVEFRNQFYNSNNALFVVAGDLKNKDKVKEKIEEFSLPTGPKSTFKPFQLKEKSKVCFHQKATNQISVNFLIQSPDYEDPQSAIEDLALNCLTHGDISPLTKELVLKSSIASTIGGSTLYMNTNGSHILKSTMPPENLPRFLNEFQKMVTNILDSGFNIQEIERIRKQYIASKIFEKETIESYAFSLGHSYAQSEDIHSEDNFISYMRDASTQDIHRALLNIFSRFIHISVQVPEKMDITNSLAKFEKIRDGINKKALSCLKKLNDVKFTTSNFDPEVKSYSLKKKVSFIHRQNKLTPTFAMHIYFKGGVAHEDLTNNGIFNLIAKNLTYGHKDCKYEELKNFLEQNSCYINGFAGKNAYGLTMHGLSENFKTLVKHFFMSLLEPTIPNQYLKLEKELLNRAIHIQKEDPVKQCFKTFNKIVFNNHPYSQDIIGTTQSLKKIKKKDILETHQHYLENSEIVISYCGDLASQNVIEAMKPYISQLNARTGVKKKSKTPLKVLNRSEHLTFDREQTHIVIGKKAFKINTDNDLYLKMLTTYLSGQSSELFVKVRDEMGLCYSCQPLHLTALEAGYWAIYIGSGHDKKESAKVEILKILKKLKTRGLPLKEFKRIKKMIAGQNLLGVQTNDDYANFYSIPVLHDLGLDFQHITIGKINDLKHADFNKFLNEFLVEDWNIIEVGP